MTDTTPCAICGSPFYPARATSRFCSEACRLREWRQRQTRAREWLAALRGQRARLAAEAEAALASGDVEALTAVARRTADLLAA